MGKQSRHKKEHRGGNQSGQAGTFYLVPVELEGVEEFDNLLIRQGNEIAAKACYELNRKHLAVYFALHQYPYFWELHESNPFTPVRLWELTPPENSLQPYVLKSTPWSEALRCLPDGARAGL